MKCDCTDWKENMPKVEAPWRFAIARNPGTWNYDGVVFRFCPWCAKALTPEAP